MQQGRLGSVGSLVEVAASSPAMECRSVWRLRGGKLQPVAIHAPAGPLPACASAGEWTARFEQREKDAPALYVRERTRQTPRGAHRESHAYRFSGFQLDLARVSADVGGVDIPDWNDATLYPRPAVEALFERFDLAPLRTMPRLSIDADQARGAFSLRFLGAREVELPVRGSVRGPEGITLSVDGEAGPLDVLVRLARDVPYEVEIRGLGSLDHLYVPVARIQDGAFRVYPDAASEVASVLLPGTWTTESRQTATIAAAPGALGRIQFDGQSFSIDVDRAPEGMDVLLLSDEGKKPVWGIDLRGPHAFVRMPVRCASWPSPPSCSGAAAGETWRRIGARMNLR